MAGEPVPIDDEFRKKLLNAVGLLGREKFGANISLLFRLLNDRTVIQVRFVRKEASDKNPA